MQLLNRKSWLALLTLFLSGPVLAEEDPRRLDFLGLASFEPAGWTSGWQWSPASASLRDDTITTGVSIPLETSMAPLIIEQALAPRPDVLPRSNAVLPVERQSGAIATLEWRLRNWRIRVRQGAMEAAFAFDPLLSTVDSAHPDAVTLETGVDVAYTLRRMQVRMGLGYQWTQANSYEIETSPDVTADVGVAFGLGQFSKSAEDYPVHMLLGVTSRMGQESLDESLPGASPYGQLFLSPGVEFHSRNVSFMATVEMPLVEEMPERDMYAEHVRATVGLRYLLK